MKVNFSNILNFEPIPLGAGSIGQVHKAILHNREIVLKIRYPNIEKTLTNDLALMLPIAKAYELFRPKSKDLTILLNEAKIMLMQEMNYEMEADFLVTFQEALKEDNRFCIPEVLSEYTNKNIICMEYSSGISLKEFLATEYDFKRKILIATSLLDLFIIELFQMGLVQTDPKLCKLFSKK